MANRHMERYSISLIIRETQIKTLMRCYLPSVRMAIIKKKKKTRTVRIWRKRNPGKLLVGKLNLYSHFGK